MSLIRTNWNVVAELNSGRFATGKWHLDRLGAVPGETSDPELLVATVADVDQWLDRLLDKWRVGWSIFEDFRYIRPVQDKIAFESEGELYDRAGGLVLDFAPRISGSQYALDIDARGLEDDEAEARIDRILRNILNDQLEAEHCDTIEELGVSDVVIDLEVVDGTAGVAVWTAEQRDQFPFLGFGGRGVGPRPQQRRRRSRWS